MKNIRYIALLFFALLAIGCEEVVEADLNTAAPRLVIDASIDWIKGTDGSLQNIKLSKTAGYYDTVIPVVSGATVIVSNGIIDFSFIENPGTGEYVCTNFEPVIGSEYELTVISEGQVYTAVETLLPVPEIESVEQNSQGGFSGDAIEIKFYFQDDFSQSNFYLTSFETSITAIKELSAFDDEFFNGNQNFGYYLNEDLTAGDQVKFALYGISERYQQYMNILIEVSSGGGGPWGSPPTNVRGNLVNQTDSSNFALGYFRLSEVDTVEYEVIQQ